MLFPRPLLSSASLSVLLVGAVTSCSSDEATQKADPAPTNTEAAAEPAPEAPAKTRVELAREALPAQNAEEDARFTPEVRAALTAMVEADYPTPEAAIAASVAGSHRKPGNAARDEQRHTAETLSFFGVTPSSTVVEMGAGGGWYTEVLAPIVAKNGQLIIGAYDPAGDPTSIRSVYGARQEAFLKRAPEMYSGVKRFTLGGETITIGEDNSADVALAIREMHNWQRGGQLDAYVAAVFKVLKPGGTFGVVQHRAVEGTKGEDTADTGYVAQDWLIAKVTAAGFELAESSEINANPKDTKDYAKGVWTLPPNYRMGDTDRAKYEAIGESDRMTLKFKKPS